MLFTPVIGLEIHVQLNTKTKLMCRSLNVYAPDEPNQYISPFNTGQPGALPVLNKEAVKKAIRFGVAVGGQIPEYIRFDRKNYFYPDLPAGYQITQYFHPIVQGGSLSFYLEDRKTGQLVEKTVHFHRAHLETDAAKLLHLNGKTMVDFNRSGAPLIEIVTEPEIRSSEEAIAFVNELQLLVRRLGISDGDMEKGQIRFDCNISLQTEEQKQQNQLPPYKVEVKNINSVRALGRAIEFEIQRQTKILQAGQLPSQETRGWRDDLNKSEPQRTKEEAHDYRYFPEPDLPIVQIRPQDVPNLNDLPELPTKQRKRYLNMGLSLTIANIFVTQANVGQFFDRVVQTLNNPDLSLTIANLITVNLLSLANKTGKTIEDLITPTNLITTAQLFYDRKINNQGVQTILEKLSESPTSSVEDIINTYNLWQITDDTTIAAFVDIVLEKHPQVVAQYQQGKTQALDFLVGQTMKESRGKGNPQKIREILIQKLQTPNS